MVHDTLDDALWVRILRGKYATYCAGLAGIAPRPNASVIWRRIVISKGLFLQGTYMKVGNGYLMSF